MAGRGIARPAQAKRGRLGKPCQEAKLYPCATRAAARSDSNPHREQRQRMSAPFLTLTEAAATLRLHPVTLRALAAAGELSAFKIGRTWRFVEIDLVAWARAHYRRADAVGDKESTCRSTDVRIAESGGPRSAYRTEVAYAALVAPRTGKKHRNVSTTCAQISGAYVASANDPLTRGRTP